MKSVKLMMCASLALAVAGCGDSSSSTTTTSTTTSTPAASGDSGLSATLAGKLFSAAKMTDPMAIASKGVKLFMELFRVEVNRESIGLGSIYPMTPDSEDSDSADIAGMDFNTAEDYFNALCDMDNAGGANWRPYFEKNFDFSNLVLDGSEPSVPFTKDNIGWSIAKDLPESAPDFMPLLVSANFDPSCLLNSCTSPSSESLASYVKDGGPVVMITKGGKALILKTPGEITYSAIYPDTFPSVDADSGHPLTYLVPGGNVGTLAK